jgi:NADP-dependent 3-hydroxy acid dehydrogenase YdfG
MDERRVVVTGASSGIGRATAQLFAEHGWKVVGVARRADRLAELSAQTNIDVFVADVTKQTDVDALTEYLAKTGPVHALINVAGGAFGVGTVESSDPADWLKMFDVNVIGAKRMITALLPLLRKTIINNGAGGHADVVTLTSTAGHIAYEGGSGYNAAKFAAHGMVGALRLELAGEPIRVIEVAPGMVKTDEFALNRFAGETAKVEELYAGVEAPLLAADVAEAIVHSVELPGHINLDLITMRPVAQAAQHKLIRGPLKAQ